MIFIGHVKSHYVDLPVFLELIPCCWSVYPIFILIFIMTQQSIYYAIKNSQTFKNDCYIMGRTVPWVVYSLVTNLFSFFSLGNTSLSSMCPYQLPDTRGWYKMLLVWSWPHIPWVLWFPGDHDSLGTSKLFYLLKPVKKILNYAIKIF